MSLAIIKLGKHFFFFFFPRKKKKSWKNTDPWNGTKTTSPDAKAAGRDKDKIDVSEKNWLTKEIIFG